MCWWQGGFSPFCLRFNARTYFAGSFSYALPLCFNRFMFLTVSEYEQCNYSFIRLKECLYDYHNYIYSFICLYSYCMCVCIYIHAHSIIQLIEIFLISLILGTFLPPVHLFPIIRILVVHIMPLNFFKKMKSLNIFPLLQ